MNIQHLIRIYAATIEIKQNLTLINRAVHNLEPRFTARVLRTLTGLRKKLYREALQEVVNDVYPKSQSSPLSNRYIETY
jgi:26S proteasome regulatory subunit N3